MNAMWARRCAGGAAALVTAGLCVAGVADATIVQPHVTPTWQTNGRVETIRVVGSNGLHRRQVHVGAAGRRGAGSGEVTRNGAAAINLANGSVLPWNPNVNGTVMSLVVSGKTVVLGGSFTQVGNQTHTRLAAVAHGHRDADRRLERQRQQGGVGAGRQQRHGLRRRVLHHRERRQPQLPGRDQPVGRLDCELRGMEQPTTRCWPCAWSTTPANWWWVASSPT